MSLAVDVSPGAAGAGDTSKALIIDGVEIVRYRYLEWQKEVRNQILYHGARRVWLPCAARVGKDRMSNMLAGEISIGLAISRIEQEIRRGRQKLTPRVNIWVVAPTMKLLQQSWQEVLEFFPKSLLLSANKQNGEMLFSGDIRVAFKSADRPENLVSEGVDILIITEASRIKSGIAWGESLQPRLESPGRFGLALINGTPRNGKSHWYRRGCERAAILHTVAKSQRKESFEVCYQHPMWINPLMADKIDRLMDSMPARMARYEIEGLWPDEEEKPFRDSDVKELMWSSGEKPEGPYFVAIDVARFVNWTAATVWALGDDENPKPRVVAALGMRNVRQGQQILRLEALCKRWPGEIIIDCTANGGNAFQEGLEDKLNRPIVGYNFAGGRRDVLVESFIIAVENHSFGIRTDLIDKQWMDEIVKEFDIFDCTIDDDGKVVYAGDPDDFIMSMALGWHLIKSAGGVSDFNMADFLLGYY